MTEKRLFYVSTEKKALENEDWVSFVDEDIIGFGFKKENRNERI